MKIITISDYQICLDPMPSALFKKLSKEDVKKYISILEDAQFYPHRVFEEVKAFQEKHPELPEAVNLLTYVYIQKKTDSKSRKFDPRKLRKKSRLPICEN